MHVSTGQKFEKNYLTIWESDFQMSMIPFEIDLEVINNWNLKEPIQFPLSKERDQILYNTLIRILTNTNQRHLSDPIREIAGNGVLNWLLLRYNVETKPSSYKVVELMSSVASLNKNIPATVTSPANFAKWKDDILHDINIMKDINQTVDALFCSIILSQKDDDHYFQTSSSVLTSGADVHVLNVLNHYQNFHANSFTNKSSTFINNNNPNAYNAINNNRIYHTH